MQDAEPVDKLMGIFLLVAEPEQGDGLAAEVHGIQFGQEAVPVLR